MSAENVETVREGFARFVATGQFAEDLATDDVVWDMSNFHGWPEQQVYEGASGAQAFLSEWVDAWEDWELELEAFHDVGDTVVVLLRQRGRSKAAGMPVEMAFAQVFTFRDGKQARIEVYSDRREALAAAGVSEQREGPG
jgi:ketosteroid isomerase-like protein